MAIHTLPNGATWDTSLSYQEQRDNTGSMAFIDTIRADNTVVTNTIAGPDPNFPKPVSDVWTDTSYTGSNYIFTISYNYMNNHTYALQGTAKTFVIESK